MLTAELNISLCFLHTLTHARTHKQAKTGALVVVTGHAVGESHSCAAASGYFLGLGPL